MTSSTGSPPSATTTPLATPGVTLSVDERTNFVSRGPVTWTARRVLRRMLEHDWEHLQELAQRVEVIRAQTVPTTVSRYPMLARR